MKKAIQFGAGNIGRGFIGYLLGRSGYRLVFADVFDNVIDEINKEKHYTIYIKDVELEEIEVDSISAVNSTTDAIVDEILNADIITTAVGPLNLVKIAPAIAKGIVKRMNSDSKEYLNIIACENAIYASRSLKEDVYKNLNDKEKAYADKYIGFPSCSVDRIVPPSKNEKMLDVTVENYFEWNVEKNEFKGGVPDVYGMNPVDNLLPYIERKLFTLNTGHAITAYTGRLKGYKTIEESIADKDIENLVRAAMRESGRALIKEFGFDEKTHFAYIEKILKRFTNPYLQDDVNRVGREPIRKLSPEERLVKPLNTALSYDLCVDHLIQGIGNALHFDSKDDKQAIELQEMIKKDGLEETIKEVTKIKDSKVIEKIIKAYKEA